MESLPLAHCAGENCLESDLLRTTVDAALYRRARVVSETRKFDHGLTQILHDDLRWLDVTDRVTYKLGVIMHRCRHDKALQYLVDCCTPVTNVVGRQRLRSAARQLYAGAITSASHCRPPSIRQFYRGTGHFEAKF